MRAVLLDGSQADDSAGARVRATLAALLRTRGWEVEHVVLRERKIGSCAGDFFCWVRFPGTCNVDDDNRAIAQALASCDLMVYLTPVTFGGYASTLKRMVDHQIQNVSPFFAKIEGETHHHRRYVKNPDLLAVGWLAAPDAEAAAVFRHLARRNAINWHSKAHASDVILASRSDEELLASARQWLDDLRSGQSSRAVELPKDERATQGSSGVRRALLLVGSPRTRKSTSNSLGGYLLEQLSAQAVQTETIYLHTVLRNSGKMQALLAAVDAADLVTLAFPLYADSLPAPVIEALERIAAHRQGRDRSLRQVFTAIANCGFPEAHHCATALAICETFAQQAGFAWAGGLALGGGEMVHGAPLASLGGQGANIRRSLVMAAAALAQGQAIPEAAKALLGKPLVPPWAYRLFSGLSWLQRARPYGAVRSLWRRPYLAKAR